MDDIADSPTSPTSPTSERPSPLSPIEPPGERKASKTVKKYYKKQNELLEYYRADEEHFEKLRIRLGTPLQSPATEESEGPKSPGNSAVSPIGGPAPISVSYDDKEMAIENRTDTSTKKRWQPSVEVLANTTLCINLSLVFAKAFAAWLSGSLSIFSSLADSLVDITSGALIFLATRFIRMAITAIRKRDPWKYPRGRTRLEPISLVVISVIMGFASFQLIVESIRRIASGDTEVDMNISSATIMICTIALKTVLAVVYYRFASDTTIRVLAMDHRNDVISNSAALLCAAFTPLPGQATTFFGTPGWKYLDPIGAILVAIFILKTWIETGREQVTMLAGRSADPDFINRIVKVAMEHDKRIQHVDNVYVYHYGTTFLVEVDIVLPEEMQLRQTHDIAEGLQIGIESLPDVERAFVHVDYEYMHKAHEEHKIV